MRTTMPVLWSLKLIFSGINRSIRKNLALSFYILKIHNSSDSNSTGPKKQTVKSPRLKHPIRNILTTWLAIFWKEYIIKVQLPLVYRRRAT
jgi:hypothetical protein